MEIEFLDDFGDVVTTVPATRALTGELQCEECGDPMAYRFSSDTGMVYTMCVPCIDADEYVRRG